MNRTERNESKFVSIGVVRRKLGIGAERRACDLATGMSDHCSWLRAVVGEQHDFLLLVLCAFRENYIEVAVPT